MTRLSPPTPITAIVYSEGWKIDTLMRDVADHLRSGGCALAGFVQINQPRPGRSRCDMVLEELSSGTRIGISQDRGEHARGCMLDVDELLRAGALATQGLERNPDLLMINKFGKTECEGGGFRALIAEALAREVPVLIAVPVTNLGEWRVFADGLTTNHLIEAMPPDTSAICEVVELNVRSKQLASAQ
jgi:nucleoside-triphosphatase THEP1